VTDSLVVMASRRIELRGLGLGLDRCFCALHLLLFSCIFSSRPLRSCQELQVQNR
jgi:hypothetical protein